MDSPPIWAHPCKPKWRFSEVSKILHLALEGCAQFGLLQYFLPNSRPFGHTPLRPNEVFLRPQEIANGLMFHTEMSTFGPPRRPFSCRRVEKSTTSETVPEAKLFSTSGTVLKVAYFIGFLRRNCIRGGPKVQIPI